VTFVAPLIVATAVASETRSRVYSAVDPVLRDIISPVGHFHFRFVLELVAGFQFFLIGMAVSAEGSSVAGFTNGLFLGSIEPVLLRIIGCVVEDSPLIVVAIAAYRRGFELHGMVLHDRFIFGKDKKCRREQ
jgi:hypothetical protein